MDRVSGEEGSARPAFAGLALTKRVCQVAHVRPDAPLRGRRSSGGSYRI